MGSSGSKSVFDRRNSVERRTQRRHLQNYKQKIEHLAREVDKVTPSSEDGHVERLKQELAALKRDMPKRCAHLQHKNKPMYDSLYQKLDPLLEKIAVRKLEELRIEEDARPESAISQKVRQANAEANNNNGNKVELNIIRIESPEPEVVERNPEGGGRRDVGVDRRESVLKLGVAVMPNVAHELPNKIAEARRVSFQQVKEDAIRTVEAVKRDVGELEIKISEFVGRKNGKRYRILKGELARNHHAISKVENCDGDVVEQKELCKRYIGNCLSFLEEKAAASAEESESDDEVFYPTSREAVGGSAAAKPIRATLI